MNSSIYDDPDIEGEGEEDEDEDYYDDDDEMYPGEDTDCK